MNEPLNAHHSYVEYQIGHTIADTLEVAKLNNLPHAESRSPYYEKTASGWWRTCRVSQEILRGHRFKL